MLSIEECRKTLEKYGEYHTDEEIKQIRELLYLFVNSYIEDLENQNHEKCHHLHPSINRRTSREGIQSPQPKGSSTSVLRIEKATGS